MSEEKPQDTLRETLEKAYDEHVEPEVSTPVESETPKTETVSAEEKPGRTAGRPRDEKGRLLPGAPQKEQPKEQPVAAAPPSVAAEPAKTRPARPSSWKKEYWDHWDKLDPALAEYIHQREGEYASGVSTYKNEWERAKPLIDAVAPYQADFERFGINPAQQIAKYAEVHKTLALGSPEQKLGMFLRMAQEYRIPVEQLFVKDEQGQVFFNQQLMQQHAQAQAQPPAQNVQEIVAKTFAQYLGQQQARDFIAAKDASGNPVHPHYEVVRETMAQLLDAGLANDIPSAYEAALRHPRHSEIFDAQQKLAREKEDAERQRKAKEDAERARRNTVSPRTATPSGTTTGAAKGLHAQLEEAYDQHVTGRV